MKINFYCSNCREEIKHGDEINEGGGVMYCPKCIDKTTRSKFTKIDEVEKPKKKKPSSS